MSFTGLSDPQRRSVFACLRGLEDRLDQMEGWLQKAGSRSGGAVWVNDIGSAERTALAFQITEVRRSLEALFMRLGHSPESISVFQRCQAALGLNWEDSLDLRGQRLRNYGPLPEETALAMNALAESLADQFQQIRHALGAPKEP